MAAKTLGRRTAVRLVGLMMALVVVFAGISAAQAQAAPTPSPSPQVPPREPGVYKVDCKRVTGKPAKKQKVWASCWGEWGKYTLQYRVWTYCWKKDGVTWKYAIGKWKKLPKSKKQGLKTKSATSCKSPRVANASKPGVQFRYA